MAIPQRCGAITIDTENPNNQNCGRCSNTCQEGETCAILEPRKYVGAGPLGWQYVVPAQLKCVKLTCPPTGDEFSTKTLACGIRDDSKCGWSLGGGLSASGASIQGSYSCDDVFRKGYLVSCVDPNLDPHNCGGCGKNCNNNLPSDAINPFCNAGKCDYECMPPKKKCFGLCNDPSLFMHDRFNCNECGEQCTFDQVCTLGVCECVPGTYEYINTYTHERTCKPFLCPDGQTTGTDANCNSCGNKCIGGQTCMLYNDRNSAYYHCECPVGQSFINGACQVLGPPTTSGACQPAPNYMACGPGLCHLNSKCYPISGTPQPPGTLNCGPGKASCVTNTNGVACASYSSCR